MDSGRYKFIGGNAKYAYCHWWGVTQQANSVLIFRLTATIHTEKTLIISFHVMWSYEFHLPSVQKIIIKYQFFCKQLWVNICFAKINHSFPHNLN